MNPTFATLLLVLAGILLFLAIIRFQRFFASVNEPAQLPIEPKENDKLIVVRGATEREVSQALRGFCSLYNEREQQAVIQLTEMEAGPIALTFPYDIDLDVFGFLVNYLVFPIDLEWNAEVLGWCTVPKWKFEIAGKSFDGELMFYTEKDPEECENICATTQDNVGFSLGFIAPEMEGLLPREKVRPFVERPWRQVDLQGRSSFVFR